MDKTSAIISGLMMVALVVLFAPNILKLNRGKILRNIALWLAIFLGLSLAYKYFHPNALSLAPDAEVSDQPEDQGYTPPKE
ncbi:MAG: hypothetical protein PHX43_02560 [Alphaproteobacteria bacterium]|nr:hypothetical protein [Alphaproteobacteria bacterium]